jgi:hypothetical protein
MEIVGGVGCWGGWWYGLVVVNSTAVTPTSAPSQVFYSGPISLNVQTCFVAINLR